MQALLASVTGHAMNYAIRSGINITATYAASQAARLLKEAPRGVEREELLQLQRRLESKIRIVSPAIDMIELISARGNTTLDSAVNLSKEIRYEIQKLGARLSNAANVQHAREVESKTAKSKEESEHELKSIITSIKALLNRIEDAVPLINLAITTSGVSLSTKLSGAISPSRLLQASTFVTTADSQYLSSPGKCRRQQVGPTYTLSMYMLFAGHARQLSTENGVRDTTWKEVLHKARVKLVRLPLDELYHLPGENHLPTSLTQSTIPAEVTTSEFAYQLLIIEDLDDGRFHNYDEIEDHPEKFDDVLQAGIRDVVPIHEISKVFYADTGKILNIDGESGNSPVLLLKRDVHAEPPRRMIHRSQINNYFDDSMVSEERSEIDDQTRRESLPNSPADDVHSQRRLPADLDPEWMAFEVFTEEAESDSDIDDNFRDKECKRDDCLGADFTSAWSKMRLSSASPSSSPQTGQSDVQRHGFLSTSISTNDDQHQSSVTPERPISTLQQSPNQCTALPVKTSISLLEMLLKLTALQQFRQESHLAIEDELLNFFLENSATAGAGPDKDYRQRLRHNAIHRVGFDPYDESPIKRRTEEYIEHARGKASPQPPFNPNLCEVQPYNHEDDDFDDEPDAQSTPSFPCDVRFAQSTREVSKSRTLAPNSTLNKDHNSTEDDCKRDDLFSVDTPCPVLPRLAEKLLPRDFSKTTNGELSKSPLRKEWCKDGLAD
ncbi:Ran-binding-domain-containing protein [Acrodontium crateriforme]|uniref:Ran-binding-domain-containing protein n=1 Tax=Acrodontium crateriforme TaxID=150365 RepID=A0AAQ3M4C0_9PEZI|nr:Ran-binding-domain-containing protein [Acrodontium crateriforme]